MSCNNKRSHLAATHIANTLDATLKSTKFLICAFTKNLIHHTADTVYIFVMQKLKQVETI